MGAAEVGKAGKVAVGGRYVVAKMGPDGKPAGYVEAFGKVLAFRTRSAARVAAAELNETGEGFWATGAQGCWTPTCKAWFTFDGLTYCPTCRQARKAVR